MLDLRVLLNRNSFLWGVLRWDSGRGHRAPDRRLWPPTPLDDRIVAMHHEIGEAICICRPGAVS
jgi:hypothetical protein